VTATQLPSLLGDCTNHGVPAKKEGIKVYESVFNMENNTSPTEHILHSPQKLFDITT